MSHCDVGAASPPMPAAPAYDGHASEQKERSSMRSHWPNHEHGSWQITPDAHDMNCKTRKPGCAKQYMSTLDAFAVKADRPSETSPFDDSQADAETQARRSHKLPAPLCSCGCRRRIYESYLRRGDSSNIGAVRLARTGQCAARLAAQLPTDQGELLELLLRLVEAGPLAGHGCGPRRKARAALEALIAETQRARHDQAGTHLLRR